MTIRILEPEAFPQAAIDRLANAAPVALGWPNDDVDSATQAIFIRLADRIDAKTHRRFPNLKWIVSPTTGLDRIDLDYFAGAGVEVISLRGRTEFLGTIHATAEHTIALTLALLRDIPGAAAAVKGGAWDRYPHKGRELFGKRVLLLGYGRIARLVAPILEAFGCTVLAHDVVEGRVPERMACAFPAVLNEIDILSVHLPLADDTLGLVDASMLARLPAHALVINTARGQVIDQTALFDVLENGRLAGAALDVLDGEPEPLDAALRARIEALGSRLVVTPHIGGFTFESLEAVEVFMADTFLAAYRALA